MDFVDFDELDSAHNAVVAGVKYPVRAMTPKIANQIDSAMAKPDAAERTVATYGAVALLVPTMPRDVLDDMNWRQLFRLIAIANYAVKKVDEAASVPNGPRSASAEPGGAERTETSLAACS